MRKSMFVPASLLCLLSATVVPAQRIGPEGGGSPLSGEYQFVIGLPPIDPDIRSVIMSAENGDRIEVLGDGGFHVPWRSARGAGTFVQTDPGGNETGRGSWRVVEFVSFNPYDGPSGFGSKLQLFIALIPEDGSPAIRAKMQVVCHPESPQPESRFAAAVLIQETGQNFNKWENGATFIYKLHVDPSL